MRLNSYDDWSTLKEVVVGTAKNYTSHQREISFDLFFADNLAQSSSGRASWAYPRASGVSTAAKPSLQPIKDRYVAELNEDLDGLVRVLESLQVKVHRPLDIRPDQNDIAGLTWTAPMIPALNLRDTALILGNEIVETPPMIRSRYYETRLLQGIFLRYFGEGARWSTMPRPLMTDLSFDPSYAIDTAQFGTIEPIEHASTSEFDVGYEIMIDAAQCLRLGVDVVVNVANENHIMGLDWLRRHFDGRFQFHQVDRISDGHIDTMILALRPGLLLLRNEGVREKLPDWLRGWDAIIAPEPQPANFPDYEDDDLTLTSEYIDLNVLSVDETTVVVNEACPDMMRTLEGRGFTVVPVRHRHRRLFGGGFHCFTLDTVRLGGPHSYR